MAQRIHTNQTTVIHLSILSHSQKHNSTRCCFVCLFFFVLRELKENLALNKRQHVVQGAGQADINKGPIQGRRQTFGKRKLELAKYTLVHRHSCPIFSFSYKAWKFWAKKGTLTQSNTALSCAQHNQDTLPKYQDHHDHFRMTMARVSKAFSEDKDYYGNLWAITATYFAVSRCLQKRVATLLWGWSKDMGMRKVS